MSDQSPVLGMPYIQASQAQKHVTHNEAIQLLDALVQLSVHSRNLSVPPVAPTEGDRYIVGPGATGTWVGQTGRIALFDGVVWQFLVPKPGWQAHIVTESAPAIFSGTAWQTPAEMAQSFAMLGVNATADTVNRLAVSSAGTLLNHAGSGHQLKINKAVDTDTASLLFQTGFSGRAEMGVVGSDDFDIKVSASGNSFATALSANRTTGQVTLPAGLILPDGTVGAPSLAFAGDGDTGIRHPAADQVALVTGGAQRALLSTSAFQLDLPLTGASVQSSATDTTSTRVLKVGAFGLGSVAIALGTTDNLNSLTATGFYYNPTASNTTGNSYPISSAGSLLNLRRAATNWVQQFTSLATNTDAATVRIFTRSYGATGWSPWVEQFHQGTILGTVSQTAGVPTGRVIERGSNSNGEFVRFADGTQICTFAAAAVDTTAATGALFMHTNLLSWTFPVAFIAAPAVTGGAGGAQRWLGIATPTTTTVSYRVLAAITDATTFSPRLTAIGRWF